ncbi:MAG: type III pantothenate kinase [Fusobacteria bacterium]|nr:MAG: type III pantothenate kinase [Fusobacteriota bacterium]
MLIAFDIGNTHIVTGVLDEKGSLITSFRIATKDNITEDELFSYLKNITDFNKIELTNVTGVIVSSVVPGLIRICDYLAQKYFNLKPLIINLDLNLPFKFANNLNNSGFGADRIIDIVQGIKLYPNKDLVIFDFGTATTYEILVDKVYVGGGILPGINMAINSLFGNTAQLPKVKFENPHTIAGKNTVEQIQAGIFYGYTGQIKEIIRKIKEIHPNAYVIATGGLGQIISHEVDSIDKYLPDLSLEGMYSIWLENK